MFWVKSPWAIRSRAIKAYQSDLQTTVLTVKWASQEQSTGVGQVGQAVTQMDQTTQQNAALVEESAAAADSLQGQALWTLGEAGSPEVEAYGIALKHQLESIKLRPTHAQAWANLSLLHYAVNDPADTLFAAWREAARLGPKEEDVENTLVRVAGDTWSIAPADVRAWVEERRPGFTKQMEPQPAN